VIKSRLQVRGKQTALVDGYSSRSKTFTDYVRRVLRQDGRFVTNAEGQWMLRAAA